MSLQTIKLEKDHLIADLGVGTASTNYTIKDGVLTQEVTLLHSDWARGGKQTHYTISTPLAKIEEYTEPKPKTTRGKKKDESAEQED